MSQFVCVCRYLFDLLCQFRFLQVCPRDRVAGSHGASIFSFIEMFILFQEWKFDVDCYVGYHTSWKKQHLQRKYPPKDLSYVCSTFDLFVISFSHSFSPVLRVYSLHQKARITMSNLTPVDGQIFRMQIHPNLYSVKRIVSNAF